MICIDFIKGKLTASEAYRNLGEMSDRLTPEHLEEIDKLIVENTPESFEGI